MRLRELIEADPMGDIFGAQIDRAWEKDNERNQGTTNPFSFSADPTAAPQTIDPARLGTGSVGYVAGYNQKKRNKPIDKRLMTVLKRAAADAGVKVLIFSGGQDAKGTGTRRTGSTRHDNGLAADIYVYDGKGRQLSTRGDDPLVVNFVAALKRAGAQGLGAHPGYMGGKGFHVDIVGTSQGGGSMWGAGGKGKPPSEIARAFTTGKGVDVA